VRVEDPGSQRCRGCGRGEGLKFCLIWERKGLDSTDWRHEMTDNVYQKEVWKGANRRRGDEKRTGEIFRQ